MPSVCFFASVLSILICCLHFNTHPWKQAQMLIFEFFQTPFHHLQKWAYAPIFDGHLPLPPCRASLLGYAPSPGWYIPFQVFVCLSSSLMTALYITVISLLYIDNFLNPHVHSLVSMYILVRLCSWVWKVSSCKEKLYTFLSQPDHIGCLSYPKDHWRRKNLIDLLLYDWNDCWFSYKSLTIHQSQTFCEHPWTHIGLRPGSVGIYSIMGKLDRSHCLILVLQFITQESFYSSCLSAVTRGFTFWYTFYGIGTFVCILLAPLCHTVSQKTVQMFWVLRIKGLYLCEISSKSHDLTCFWKHTMSALKCVQNIWMCLVGVVQIRK